MKILVAYFSRSGNTKQVAQSIFDTLPAEKEIITIGSQPASSEYDLLFLGFPIESYGPPKKITKYLKDLTKNQPVVFFLTHGVPVEHPLLSEWRNTCKTFFHPNAQIIDTFSVQCEVADYVVESLKKSENEMVRAWGNHSHHLIGMPTTDQLTQVREIINKILTRVQT